AKAFSSVEQAQAALCPPFRVFQPDPESAAVYNELYPLYRRLYFSLGRRNSEPAELGAVLPELRRVAAHARQAE
ncbi:MAG: ribulokinase, partial [Bryobacteraceae bacterium]